MGQVSRTRKMKNAHKRFAGTNWNTQIQMGGWRKNGCQQLEGADWVDLVQSPVNEILNRRFHRR